MPQSKLTKAARGQTCTVNIYPYCAGENTETVVFAHAPSEDKGMGRKSPDWWGADCCAACHDIVDGRHKPDDDDITREVIGGCFVRGIFKTLKRRIKQGVINL